MAAPLFAAPIRVCCARDWMQPGAAETDVGAARCQSPGFTLVELLVAMVVSLILIVFLLQVFNSATASWQRGEAQADSFREARGALQLMARDLSSTIAASYAQLPPGANTATTATPQMPTLVLNRYSYYTSEGIVLQPSPNDATNEQINEEVYCLTNISSPPAATTSQAPAQLPTATPIAAARQLCAVGYFCQWLPDIAPYNGPNYAGSAPHAFGLMRQYLNGDGTFLRFSEAYTKHSNIFPNSSTTPLNFADIWTRAQVSLVPAATPAADMAQSSELAAYIYDLKFRIDTNLVVPSSSDQYPYDNGEPSNSTDSPAPVDHSTPPSNHYGDLNNQTKLPPLLPPYIEIRFKALSENAGRRLEGNTSVTPQSWNAMSSESTAPNSIFRTFILPHSEQFVLRVPLLNGTAAPTPAP